MATCRLLDHIHSTQVDRGSRMRTRKSHCLDINHCTWSIQAEAGKCSCEGLICTEYASTCPKHFHPAHSHHAATTACDTLVPCQRVDAHPSLKMTYRPQLSCLFRNRTRDGRAFHLPFGIDDLNWIRRQLMSLGLESL